MRSLFWPLLLLVILWVFSTAVLPEWMNIIWVPRLVLAGLLVLAVTDGDFSWHWLAPFTGLVFDISSGVLIGSYTIGFTLIYVCMRLFLLRLVPSDKIMIALGVSFLISTLILGVWIWVYTGLARLIGFPVIPVALWYRPLAELIRGLVGSGVTIGIYLLWLEFMYSYSKPLRQRRIG